MVHWNNGNTWVSDALLDNDPDQVRHAIENNPSLIEERDFVGDTPLMNAIDFGCLELVRWLIEAGANVNAEVDDGFTPLHSAIESDADVSTTIVGLLLKAGAEIEARGCNGWTPLQMAACRGYLDKVKVLVEAGADINARLEIDAEETVLMEAAFGGNADVVRFLLQKGADPTARDSFGRTAAKYAKRWGHPDAAQILDSWMSGS